MQQVTDDLRDLHLQAGGTNDAALRAIQIERDSIENLLKEIIALGTIEARSDTFAARIVGDVRSAVVGGAVGAAMTGAGKILGPDAAASFAQMVQTLQPQIAALMTALHGQGSSLTHSADWVTAKLRHALKT